MLMEVLLNQKLKPPFRMYEWRAESEILEILMLVEEKRSQKRRLAFEYVLVRCD